MRTGPPEWYVIMTGMNWGVNNCLIGKLIVIRLCQQAHELTRISGKNAHRGMRGSSTEDSATGDEEVGEAVITRTLPTSASRLEA